MAIINQEALNERARMLYTVPKEIPLAQFESMPEDCKTALEPHYYTLNADDEMYVLGFPITSLGDSVKFEILHCLGLPNGISKAIVHSLTDGLLLDVHFFNRNYFDRIIKEYSTNDETAKRIFPISGGHRVKAGDDENQVKAISIVDPDPEKSILRLEIAPIGDYSTYTLGINRTEYPNIDPMFCEIHFKFRPGCFNINCAPEWEPAPKPKSEPVIDYLAKDYDSFKHTLITAMMERVPGWEATSEADLDQVLIDLFSAAADELSDFQDRVMNEAYLGTARKRVSLARHARLMDYHIHQGNQASTWLALELKDTTIAYMPGDFQVWAGRETKNHDSVVFSSGENQSFLFTFEIDVLADLNAESFSSDIENEFEKNGIEISPGVNMSITRIELDKEWIISDNNKYREFIVRQEGGGINVYAAHLHYLLNRMGLYTWENSVPALEAGSVTADLKVGDGSEKSAKVVETLIRDSRVTHLLVQEEFNPLTGRKPGRDPTRRQVLQLIPGEEGAEALEDPMTNLWYVRVRWQETDKLKNNYCFTVDCPDGKKEEVSFFNGNLVNVFHGKPVEITFKEPGTTLESENEYYYERTENEKWGALCRLPEGTLAYRETKPGGDIPSRSSLEVKVEVDGTSDPWEEVISLVHSGTTAERGDHFVVETDEEERSLIRFGNGINGRELPGNGVVRCKYQVGKGPEGNIGCDTLKYFSKDNGDSPWLSGKIASTWNPFDVTNGRAPEPPEEILRRVPEAYRSRQLRAVTLKDYEDRAEELEEVSRAAARYAWTGSWRTVRVTIDPAGTTALTDKSKEKIARHLEAVRLIGEDIEIRPPQWVPLEIEVSLCVHPHYWPEDIKYILEQEFSEGYLPDGRAGFFHPDNWTFGHPLRTSQIFGRVQAVKGVDHVVSVSMKRWNEAAPGTTDIITVEPNEIIRVKNDPDHMEEGSITFDVRGGRQ
jgi:hypothetical protein